MKNFTPNDVLRYIRDQNSFSTNPGERKDLHSSKAAIISGLGISTGELDDFLSKWAKDDLVRLEHQGAVSYTFDKSLFDELPED